MGNLHYSQMNNASQLNYSHFNTNDPSSIIKPFLFLGSSYGNRNSRVLEYLGISHVLNVAVELQNNLELINNPRIKLRHVPASDSERYNIRYDFDTCFEFIDEARHLGGKVLVHCMMGVSRSATIVIAYLMSRYRMSFNEAFHYVKSRRPEIQPNRYFMKILSDYESELRRPQQYYSNSYAILSHSGYNKNKNKNKIKPKKAKSASDLDRI